MTEIITLFGTRPEIIKMSQMIPLLDKNFDHRFVFTGQHFSKQMVDVFFEQLKVRKPDVYLTPPSSETSSIVGSDYSVLIPSIAKELKNSKAEYVIVYGDTNSTLASTLAAMHFGKKVIHIEAGLRSYDKRMAEELVRVLVDHNSDLLFTPTELTSSFLEKENIKDNKFVVGNSIVDAISKYFETANKTSKILDELKIEANNYILITLHRAENVDEPEKLMKILRALATNGHQVVYPVHPRVKKRIMEFGFKIPDNIKAIDPVGYFDMLRLLKNAALVITDSGGAQEEAITLKVPCLTLRETTERWETIAAGANFLVGSEPLLIDYYIKMVFNTDLKKKIQNVENPYGDGKTSEKIVKILKDVI